MEKAECVILGNGDFPVAPQAVEVLRTATYLCCCDGAATTCIAHGIMPHAIVGDGDSLPETFKQQYRHLLHFVDEQEDNDLTKATRHCMALGMKRIAYIGATGKREDHTLGNISLMERYLREFQLQPVMLTDHGMFIPAQGTCTFSTFARQQVSIFNFSCRHIRSEGLKWDAYNYRSWWQGTLNEATGNSITLHTDGSYIVYLTYLAKE